MRERTVRSVVVFAGLLLCACGVNEPAIGQATEQSASDRLRDFLYDPFDPPIGHSLVLGNAYARVVERFGEPDGVLEEPERRPRDPTRPVNFLTLSYSGMSITLSAPAGSTSTTIFRIVLEDDRRLKYGLGIGSPRADIEAFFEQTPVLKDPYQLHSEYTDIRYDYPERPGVPVSVTTFTTLTIEFDENGRATQLAWEHYAD